MSGMPQACGVLQSFLYDRSGHATPTGAPKFSLKRKLFREMQKQSKAWMLSRICGVLDLSLSLAAPVKLKFNWNVQAFDSLSGKQLGKFHVQGPTLDQHFIEQGTLKQKQWL